MAKCIVCNKQHAALVRGTSMNRMCKRVWDGMSRDEQGEIIERVRANVEEQQRVREMSKYLSIEFSIKEAIKNGTYQAGERIPTVEEIASAHDVSVSTAKRALKLLKEKGLLTAAAGQGTRVSDPLPEIEDMPSPSGPSESR
jgi:Fic family protein